MASGLPAYIRNTFINDILQMRQGREGAMGARVSWCRYVHVCAYMGATGIEPVLKWKKRQVTLQLRACTDACIYTMCTCRNVTFSFYIHAMRIRVEKVRRILVYVLHACIQCDCLLLNTVYRIYFLFVFSILLLEHS